MSQSDLAPYARAGGALWLLTAAAAIASLVIVLSFDITLSLADVPAALSGVAAHPLAHAIELAFDSLAYLSIALVAAPMYLMFAGRGRLAALLGAILLAVGGTVGVVHDLGNFAFTSIAMLDPDAGAATEIVAFGMLATAKWGVTVSAVIYSAGILVFNRLMMGLVAPVLAWGGAVAAALAIVAAPLAWIDPNLEMLGYALYLPMLIWQIGFGLLLLTGMRIGEPGNA